MLRVLAFSATLFVASIALGGLASPDLDLTENAAAECGQVSLDGDPCPPSIGCIVAGVVQKATKQDVHCTM